MPIHLYRWAAEQGVDSTIRIASFGTLRGCAATREILPGENLLSIPQEVLIYETSVRKTDLVGFMFFEYFDRRALCGRGIAEGAWSVELVLDGKGPCPGRDPGIAHPPAK